GSTGQTVAAGVRSGDRSTGGRIPHAGSSGNSTSSAASVRRNLPRIVRSLRSSLTRSTPSRSTLARPGPPLLPRRVVRRRHGVVRLLVLYPSAMADDLHQLGEDLVTTAARVVRWVPKDGYTLCLASARILARLIDNGPTRISDLATLERSSQPTITNRVKRLEADGLVRRDPDRTDARVWVISPTEAGQRQMRAMRHQLG